jgi:hypothetical protein
MASIWSALITRFRFRAPFDLIESDRRSHSLFRRASCPKAVSQFSGCALKALGSNPDAEELLQDHCNEQ